MAGAALDSRYGESEVTVMDARDLRIGDAEREQTMAALREHFAQGRLTHEELDERLDRTLAAKTARELAEVTADLPGGRPSPHGPAYQEPASPYVMSDWHAAMHAHRRQMEAMRHAHRDMRHHMRGWHGHMRRHRRGPHPLVPMLTMLLFLSLIFGGFGVFKALLVLWLGALVFSLAHRRFHRRG
ncbi:DUF1707 SHOCT-like domain-containing protein [Nonomuraea sp. NPDC052634]|jgi:hypothetical protein|uniref:DUF1707 SHOCT-like domain-containing protein n=1 Tax=Nonomuraea sp. NPDC052634 TaxID=3155813 RepID=UPI0034291ECA